MSKDRGSDGLLEIDKAFLERAAELFSGLDRMFLRDVVGVKPKRVLTRPCPGPDAKTSRPCDCGKPHVTEFTFGGSRYGKTEYKCPECRDTGHKPLSDQPANGITGPCPHCDSHKAANWPFYDRQFLESCAYKGIKK